MALFNDDLFYLSEKVIFKPQETYLKASSIIRELIHEDSKAFEILKTSATLLLRRIKLLDEKIKIKLPITLSGDLANTYKQFFPKERLIIFDNKVNSLMLNYGIKILKKSYNHPQK